MTVLNDLDRFRLVMDTIDRVPQTGERGIYLKKQLRDKLIEHKRYIDLHGKGRRKGLEPGFVRAKMAVR
jgi:xylulose-5-phosphate/fructose-6-phosphate phosphoketolase